MPTLYMTEPHSVLRKADERVRVTLKKETLLDIPLLRVDSVVALGPVTITPFAMQSLMENQIPMAFLTEHGRYLGRVEPAFSKNCLLRRAQYEVAFSAERSLSLARSIVAGKLANQRTMLVRYNRTRERDELKAAIREIKKRERDVPAVETLDQLRGLEGAAASSYFSCFRWLLQDTTGFTFARRIRRPPTDPVNALLSFGYVLLANDMCGLLSGMGFDPYVGYLHSERYGRASLALDLIEEFRTPIVDSVVLSCINRQVLTLNDFETHPGDIVRLSPEARKKFLQQYEARKRSEITHPVFGYKASYLRCMELQARLMAKVLAGELDNYPAFATR